MRWKSILLARGVPRLASARAFQQTFMKLGVFRKALDKVLSICLFLLQSEILNFVRVLGYVLVSRSEARIKSYRNNLKALKKYEVEINLKLFDSSVDINI